MDKKEKLRGVPVQTVLFDEPLELDKALYAQGIKPLPPREEPYPIHPTPTSRLFDDNNNRIGSLRPESILASREKLELVDKINRVKSLTEMIEEDWMAHFENIWLGTFTNEMARDVERFNAIVGIYKEYYDQAEELDRSYPHNPAIRPRGGVTLIHSNPHPVARSNRQEHAKKRRVLLEDRKHKLLYWITTSPTQEEDDKMFGKSDLKAAAIEGLRLHENSMPRCPCEHCGIYR